MAPKTDISLQTQVIYSVYVRAHTEEGSFRAIIPDLDRIKALGTDIIWFMPIHPIGEKGKKGSLGCPYANRDYRTVNPQYGSEADFRLLVDEIHKRGMKCMIDVVYNHTSADSVLLDEHPDFFSTSSTWTTAIPVSGTIRSSPSAAGRGWWTASAATWPPSSRSPSGTWPAAW